MMIKVSVIIPVYNGETYLEECLSTVCKQTLQEIEIICIDDGSTDSSLDILRRYQKDDPRIQIYHHDHSTAGTSRNYGMSFATGEYLAFWDCDDFFDLQALEKLYNKAKDDNADVVVCGGNQFLESKNKAIPFPPYLRVNRVPKGGTFNRYTNPKHYLDFTGAQSWNKLFKSNFIKKFSIQFHTAEYGEDVFFTENALGFADRITILNEKLVNYRENVEGSLSNSIDCIALDAIQVWIDTEKRLSEYDGFGEQTFANKALESIIHTLSNLQSWDTFNKFLSILKQGGLKKLHITIHEQGYYYSDWLEACVSHLWEDTPEEFIVFLAHSRYTQYQKESSDLRDVKRNLSKNNNKIQTLQKENNNYKKDIINKENKISELALQKNKADKETKKLSEEINRIRNSWTFKIGKVITWLPSKLKKLFTREEK